MLDIGENKTCGGEGILRISGPSEDIRIQILAAQRCEGTWRR